MSAPPDAPPPPFDAIWESPAILLEIPAGAGPWGAFVGGDPPLLALPDAAHLAQRVNPTEGSAADFGWGPDDRHLRPVAEIDAVKDAVVTRGNRELERVWRERAPQAALAVAIVLGVIVFWPKDRETQMLVLLGMIIGWLPLWQRGAERAWEAWKSLRLIRTDADAWRAQEARRLRFWSWAPRHKSRAAVVLVGMFVMTHLVVMWVGLEPAVAKFGLVKSATRSGEWWRLLTSAFLHGGLIHIAFNSMAGLSLANLGRGIVDEARLVLVFFVAALFGALASVAFLPYTSVGASGGLLGWGGMLLGLSWRHKGLHGTGLESALTRWVLLLAAIGLAGAAFIDNAAHAGGFIAGLGLGDWMARKKDRPLPLWDTPNKTVWSMAIAVGGAAWLWMIWGLVQIKVGA